MAVYPPLDDRLALRRMLPSGARLTHVDKWHITLAFLGEVASPHVDKIVGLLDGVTPPGRFSLTLAGGGRFTAAVWTGIDGDVNQLAALRAEVQNALAVGGFPTDGRPFTPHLTVAYHSDRDVRRVLDGYSGKPWTVEEFALFRSQDGTYEKLGAWPTDR
ncbi:RNA 2',3'-cyclic phosphodiesterase [Micromonosporaceae bacterium Da 78-11]